MFFVSKFLNISVDSFVTASAGILNVGPLTLHLVSDSGMARQVDPTNAVLDDWEVTCSL